MSLETELPLLEQCCTSATDFLDLLSQVTEDDELGNDRLLQHRLLDQAASLANGPSELMAVSDQALLSGRIPEAAEYFERAQAAAESSDEHMVIARALAARTDQGQVIHEAIAFHVRSAAKCVSRAVELTPILVFIHDELGDRALCQSVITDDLQALAGFNDFCALGRSLVAHPAAELARMVFERSSRLCNDMHSVIAYSKVLREQLHDPEAALAVLGDAEADCQTTEEFVELAQAYRDLDDTAEHVHELMELAEEFAIDLADRVHLARGRYLVQNDLNGALETYREIIPELMDAPPLIRVGHDLAFRLNAPEDALSAFTHALERVEDFEAHMALLNALTGDGESVPDGFRDFADQLCDRIVDRFHKTGQLTALAQYRGSVLNDPSGATRIVTRAVKGARDEQSLRELITVARTLGKASHAEYL
ncbi:MAG: tetratricopeptide repeat protein, partial [Gammaproteobacteria bacterium]